MVKKVFFGVFVFIVAFGAGFGVHMYLKSLEERKTTVSSSVLLEKVKKVCKLVTVEGSFSELYSHEDYQYYDFYPFRKKALLKLKAKVTAGYDLEKITFETDEIAQTIYISNIPKPEILTVDTEISYYDISEGTFNSFSSKELTDLNKNARAFIIQKANESSLLKQAEQEGESMLELVKVVLEEAGWKVIIDKGTTYKD